MGLNLKRRKFFLMFTGATVAVLGDFVKKAFVQTNTNRSLAVVEKTGTGIIPVTDDGLQPISTGSTLYEKIVNDLKSTQATTTLEPSSLTFNRSSKLSATDDELEAAFDTLESRLFSFTSTTSSTSGSKFETSAVSRPTTVNPVLSVNKNVRLTQDEKLVAEKLLAGFGQRLNTGEINFTQETIKNAVSAVATTSIVPFPQEAEISNSGKISSSTKPGSSSSAISSTSDALLGCTWRWCRKRRWYGYRLRLNHCAVEYISAGASIVPPPLGNAVRAVAGILQAFDRGCGVTIRITWIGATYISSKSCSQCN